MRWQLSRAGGEAEEQHSPVQSPAQRRHHPSSAPWLHRLHTVSKTHTLIFIVLALQTRILTLLPCYAWSRTAQSLQSKKDEALLTYA